MKHQFGEVSTVILLSCRFGPALVVLTGLLSCLQRHCLDDMTKDVSRCSDFRVFLFSLVILWIPSWDISLLVCIKTLPSSHVQSHNRNRPFQQIRVLAVAVQTVSRSCKVVTAVASEKSNATVRTRAVIAVVQELLVSPSLLRASQEVDKEADGKEVVSSWTVSQR